MTPMVKYIYWVPEKRYSMNAFLKTVKANESHLSIVFKFYMIQLNFWVLICWNLFLWMDKGCNGGVLCPDGLVRLVSTNA